MGEDDRRNYQRMFSSRDWEYAMSRANDAHEPAEGNNIAPEERSGMAIRDMEQTGNCVTGNVVQLQQPLEARDPTPGLNPSNLKKRKNKKADALRQKKAASSSARKRRIIWDFALNANFNAAIQELGGDAFKAVPKKILELMNMPELTRENVASHLQKFRLNLKKLAQQSKAASDVGSMSLPNQRQYDSYGYNGHPNQTQYDSYVYNGHPNWESQPQYFPQMMNRNEWCQSVAPPPYRNVYMGAQMAPLYESPMLRRNHEPFPILDGMARALPTMGRSFPIDMGREGPCNSMQIPCSSWTPDFPFRSYPNGTYAGPSQDSLLDGLPYDQFSRMGIEDSELSELLNILQSQPSEVFPHQSQQRMVPHRPANAVPRQPHGSMIPNQGAAFDTQGMMVPFVDNKPNPRTLPSNAAFGSMLPDQQGGTGRSENEHGVNGLPQANTLSAEPSSGTALAPPDQQGATGTGLCEDVVGFNVRGQDNGPSGSDRGFGDGNLP